MTEQKQQHPQQHPLVQQWRKLKQTFTGYLVFIKYGDFYETFDHDARTVNAIISAKLHRFSADGPDMVGLYFTTFPSYLHDLTKAGQVVVVAEFQKDADEAKTEAIHFPDGQVVPNGTDE